MNFDLSEEQNILRDSIVRFAQGELNGDIQNRDRQHEFRRDLWEKCASLGLQGLPVPEEYGGSGVDPLTTAVALEALGYGCKDSGLNFSICAHLLACVIPVWKHGTQEQKKQFLPGLCDGSLIAVNAMTEAETGSDSFSMRTTATPCDGGYRISGAKTFCSNGPIADVAIVYAITDKEKGYYGGVSAFIVEKGTPGFEPGQRFEKMGLRTSPISELVFDDVFVPEDAVLGGLGGGSVIFTESMDWERALLGCLPRGDDGSAARRCCGTRPHTQTVRPDHWQVPGDLPSYCGHEGENPGRQTADLLRGVWAGQPQGSRTGCRYRKIIYQRGAGDVCPRCSADHGWVWVYDRRWC